MTDKPAKIDTLGEMVKTRLWTKYMVDCNAAKETLYKALSQGSSGWVEASTREALDSLVSKEQQTRWPMILKRGLQEFVNAHEQLLVEFPQLAEQARAEGYEQGQQEQDR